MDIKVKVVWGNGMTDAKLKEFHTMRDKWGVLSQAITDGKCIPASVANSDSTYGGTRTFTDSTTANAWKAFVQECAVTINVPVTVTVT